MKVKHTIIPLVLTVVTVLSVPRTPEVEEVRSIPKELLVEPHIETTVELIKEPEVINLGEFKLTAYCSCSKCCDDWANDRPVDEYGNEVVLGASGEVLTAGYSVAVDTSVIPYGTVLMINGQEYEAMDCGGAIKGNRIDVYFSDHSDALEFGVQYAEVSIREEA